MITPTWPKQDQWRSRPGPVTSDLNTFPRSDLNTDLRSVETESGSGVKSEQEERARPIDLHLTGREGRVFLSSSVTPAYLTAVGNVPVRH